jgi:hypothetical protein
MLRRRSSVRFDSYIDDASDHSDHSLSSLQTQPATHQRTCLMADVKSSDMVAIFESTQRSREMEMLPVASIL